MKKIVLTSLAGALLLTACGNKTATTEKQVSCKSITVFNATEYMKESLVEKFEKDTGIDVVYETFDSNEAMYTKFSAGVTKYDVIIPSDYMIQNLIKKDALQKLDKAQLSNAKGFFKAVSAPSFDEKLEYSMPYMWGTVGLIYNKNKVSQADLESQGWGILKNPKYKERIFVYDSERDGFMPALKNLGYSLNTTNIDEINKATAWLLEMNAATKPVYVTDQIQDSMVSGEKDIAIGYSGDANLIISQNNEMAYFTPKEGTNIWIDAMVVPKDAPCASGAHKFINFFLDPKVMEENAEYIGYSPSIEESAQALAKGVFSNIPTYIPTTRETDEVFVHNEEIKKVLSDAWLKIKVK